MAYNPDIDFEQFLSLKPSEQNAYLFYAVRHNNDLVHDLKRTLYVVTGTATTILSLLLAILRF